MYSCVVIFEDIEAITIFLFLFCLYSVGSIDAATDAAPGAGVCRVACMLLGGRLTTKNLVILTYQLTFLILQFLCCVSFILTIFLFNSNTA